MSERNRETIAPMILAAVQAYNAGAPGLIAALEAENGRMREALQLTAGALEAGRRSMAPEVVFTGEWAHLGRHRVNDILDKANVALEKSDD